ncbi:MAG: PilT/PilU family type 4a pilus ATPase [Phycisphaerae bacterium]|nr:PilT/PilU family type 4a pilus ATPase [Phycisphaerae bacterium]
MTDTPFTPQPIDDPNQASGGKAPTLQKYFSALSHAGGSDLHLKPGSVPHIRLQGQLRPTESSELSAEQIHRMALELMTNEQRTYFQRHGSIDLAYEIEGADRFRLNIYRQRGAVGVAIRRVSREIPEFDDLHLPSSIRKLADIRQGLVLLAGPTGCGKSTTIAALLELINRTRRCHILTIEDPIEYIYADKKALVSQRAIGIDVANFEEALKYLMREDPDVVLIGELRDRDTFQAALQASETGHLVFGTVHAAGAAQTIGRVLDLFGHESRDLVRQSLAFNLQAIICQKLLSCVAEGIERVPAAEILLRTPTTRQLILEARDDELPEAIRSGGPEGMQTFTESLLDLINKDWIEPSVAYEAAPNADELKMAMKGISTDRGRILGG